MANSKSNIYPIQLQGAELCLNRFDAEIKQYSGFNKNNSPFVGGCLSNIFTKDTTIEGGNSENVHIASDGNVYKAVNGGLYKNDELLFPVPEYGYSVRELSSDNSVIKYFNDDIYVFRKNVDNSNFYFLKYGDNEVSLNTEYIINENASLIQWQEFEQKGLNGVFINEDQATDSYIFIFACRSNTRYVVISIVKENGVFSLASNIQETSYEVSNFFSPVGICYNETHNQVLCFYTTFSTEEKDKKTIYDPNECIAYSMAADGTLTQYNSGNVLKNVSDNSHALMSNYISNYQILSHPYNKIILKNTVNTDLGNKSLLMIMTDPYFENIYAPYISYTIPDSSSYDYNLNSLHTISNVEETGFYNIKRGTFTPLVCDFDLHVHVTQNDKAFCVHFNPEMFYGIGFNFKDVQNGSETYSACDYALGDRFKYKNTNFSLLFNNNLLSGLGGDFVLFEGWNNVDVWSLSFSMGKLYYKTNNKTYVIEQDEVKLRKVLSQLVLNVDSNINAYDIKRSKILLFAPDYNSLYWTWTTTIYGGPIYSFYTQSNNVFIAGAVNEYALEDNASILINPVNIHIGYNYQGIMDGFIQSEFAGVVNIYLSKEDEAEVLYNRSIRGCRFIPDSEDNEDFIFYNDNLIELPYPTNTDGNISYSPTLFSEFFSSFGNDVFIKQGNEAYQLAKNNNQPVMSFYLGTLVEGLTIAFVLQGQYYGIINNQIFSIAFSDGMVNVVNSIVSVENLQFVGNTPYEALFFSKTNRTLYSFTGANVLNVKQLVDEISEVRDYLYNPGTQTVFLLTDIGVFFYGIFGQFLLELPEVTKIYLLNNGIVMSDNEGNYKYIKYYLDAGDTDYTKQNIQLETMFYGMNNETVTINDCLYVRLFSEEHESGDLVVSASTLTNEGRKTENTTFKIKSTDWDNMTHSIYLRYQPKEQRGLGVSFSINSPFKIASMSVGSQPDAILVDKISKKAINAPQRLPSANEW